MKQTVEMDKIQHNMRPGCITLKGLLGEDRRNLVDILIDDDGRGQAAGHEPRGDRLAHAGAARRRGTGSGREHHGGRPLRGARGQRTGQAALPVRGWVVQKTFVQVRNIEQDRTITYTDLHIHMIREHGFYEGKGSAFRLPPHDLVAILDVPPST
jgi:hypothetical protein